MKAEQSVKLSAPTLCARAATQISHPNPHGCDRSCKPNQDAKTNIETQNVQLLTTAHSQGACSGRLLPNQSSQRVPLNHDHQVISSATFSPRLCPYYPAPLKFCPDSRGSKGVLHQRHQRSKEVQATSEKTPCPKGFSQDV